MINLKETAQEIYKLLLSFGMDKETAMDLLEEIIELLEELENDESKLET